MTDLIERLRNFEGSDALSNGDFSLLHEAADALEAAQAKIERLVEALETCLEMEERPKVIELAKAALAAAKQPASVDEATNYE